MKSPAKKTSFLRRYTSVPSLLHLLQNKKITLLSPSTWDDRNDAFFMNQYKQQAQLKTVLALCFASATETYHHWRVFTPGSDGVCITFRRDALLAAFQKHSNVRAKKVRYKLIRELGHFRPSLRELPFLKRRPYKDEREFRIVYTDKEQEAEAKGFDIDLASIERVTLSPWMAKPLADAVKATIKGIPGCAKLKVYRTSLLENEKWKRSAMRSKDGTRSNLSAR
jgi:hypothetical protein